MMRAPNPSTCLFARRPGLWLAATAVLTLMGTQASAQFGGFSIPSIPRSSTSTAKDTNGCPKGKSKSAGSSILGGIIGQGVGRAASSAGVSSYFPSAEVADTLTNVIACKLDPEEQKQAAAATLEATRGDDVGSSASWTSNTRENVSGTSTVTARNDEVAANGGRGMQCITVTDVIIVNGEETTANKRMCRAPGSARYALAA
ncbi:hypothetical protein Saro_1328 [Novosphingobium aromaticivorans DSM 12444]|uniref:Surface antigen domain-containing protein n=1 Tax=Novosphingobium aromaticivorans (strain ATCC 700278 / DSM 12444 / CCUG 56034 / CIP 105152 / NBRC 16084 / F199) TaxID=279238 RepID=Q2G8Q1_NOVAD|nr:hypothetical protein [Novosphingobium aromaticivorans]ABD25772.1 hypothetical protein Saro_1328 [Novosphingobium aromaticivorans DSM 12444]SCY03321.1 hypothetical protein SAMN05660666_00671 [Novosphingobium aromaticivorans]